MLKVSKLGAQWSDFEWFWITFDWLKLNHQAKLSLGKSAGICNYPRYVRMTKVTGPRVSLVSAAVTPAMNVR